MSWQTLRDCDGICLICRRGKVDGDPPECEHGCKAWIGAARTPALLKLTALEFWDVTDASLKEKRGE